MNIKDMMAGTSEVFNKYFGPTPLSERLWDIRKEASELCRYGDMTQLRQESGDLLSSLLQFFNETGIDPVVAWQECLAKIHSRQAQYQAMGRKKRVALLGGAFNPPHLGHLQAAQMVLAECPGEFDEVWLVPCYNHMYGKQMVEFKHRVAMCNLMAKVDGRIKAFDYEGRLAVSNGNDLKGDTYYFVKKLLADKEFSETHNFSWVIGVDNANTSYQWVCWEYLERMIRFVVLPRQGHALQTTGKWCLQSPHIYILSNSYPMETSSTMVRNSTLEERKEFLAPAVWEYAKEHNLYGGE